MDIQTLAPHELNRRQQQAMLSNFCNEPQGGSPIKPRQNGLIGK